MNAAAPAQPDFDALDDDDAPNGQNSAALPPPGPVLSPGDPRYGRPAGAPVYSDRGAPMPTGPIFLPTTRAMAVRPVLRFIRTAAPDAHGSGSFSR